jgi:hypothetical protein
MTIENHYKRWLILGLSIAFVVLTTRRIEDESNR